MKNLFIIGQGLYDPKMIVSIDLDHKSKKVKTERKSLEKCDFSCCSAYKTAEAK